MTDEERGADNPDAPPERRRRRPAPTIDLTATDITPDPAPDATDAAASTDPPPGPGTSDAEPDGTAPHPFSTAPWRSIAAVAAGVAAVLVFGIVWAVMWSGTGDDEAIGARLAALETKLGELGARPQPAAGDAKALDELAARLSKVEAATAGDAKATDELAKRLSKVEAAPGSPGADPGLTARVGTLEAALKSMTDNLASLNHRSEDMGAAERETRARVESAVTGQADIAQLAARIAALERADKAMQDQLANKSDRPSDRAVRLAVTASALKSAVERGEPFTAELAAARPLAADAAMLDPLAPFAASGVPSAALLARELAALVPALQRATDTVGRDGSVLDRLQVNVSRLVRIVPVDEAPGDEPAAVVARINAKAARADLSGALAELDKLPPAARAAAEAWIKKVQARDAAMAAATKFASDAFTSLGKP